jgi:hypothetical protein
MKGLAVLDQVGASSDDIVHTLHRSGYHPKTLQTALALLLKRGDGDRVDSRLIAIAATLACERAALPASGHAELSHTDTPTRDTDRNRPDLARKIIREHAFSREGRVDEWRAVLGLQAFVGCWGRTGSHARRHLGYAADNAASILMDLLVFLRPSAEKPINGTLARTITLRDT